MADNGIALGASGGVRFYTRGLVHADYELLVGFPSAGGPGAGVPDMQISLNAETS